MDFKEKLENAADIASDNAVFDSNPWNVYNDGFIKGAKWLQSQPLEDKLSEYDKKFLRELYTYYEQHEAVCKEKGLYEAEMIARGSTATMRDIFGKEMFENKESKNYSL